MTPLLLETLANLARAEDGREEVLDADLLNLLMRRGTELGSVELVTQACRLGGNLCFDSPRGREAVLQAGLLPALAEALPSLSSPTSSRLWQILPAFLHNYCADSPGSLPSVMDCVDRAALHYTQIQEEDSSVEAWTSLLTGLSDHEGKLLLFSRPNVLGSLLHLLQVTQEEEGLQALLELLHQLCDDETISCQCLELGLLALLLDKLESGGNQELDTGLLDLLALISSHPEALEALLLPCSPLPSLLPSWLSSSHQRQAATAALVYGNYCTSDSNCSLLVSSSTVPATLVTLLHPDSDTKLLHAVVGCLRNLSVCKPARDLLCSLFLPQACSQLLLHLSASSDHTVTPKLVATLRLVTQGEGAACRQLGGNRDLLNCLVSISKFSLVPALAIETARLVASLVRYSEDATTLAHCIEAEGCLPLLTSLLNSPHPQLINEVLVVLNIASASSPRHPSLLAPGLDMPCLASRLAATLLLPHCPAEIKSNAVLLLHNLLQWQEESVLAVLRAEAGLKEAVQGFDCQSAVARDVISQL